MKPISLSIAIVTRNRPDSLNDTLYSLSNQTEHPAEIIISDDSNIAELQERTADLAKRYGCKYYKGPKKGLYANRNFVALKCTGTHFRTMDDDHQFPHDHIAKCLEAIKNEPDTIWTIGEYSCKPSPLPSPIPGQLHPRGFSYIPKNMKNYFGISCGGTIYPSEVKNETILNCDLYKFGNVYLEYGARLKKQGYEIKFLKTTYIIHNDLESGSVLALDTMSEARLFSMFCLSFFHQPSWRNKFLTLGQLLIDVMTFKYPGTTIFKAYRSYKIFTSKLI